MKLNLELELDWMGDDMSLDDTIKAQIINEVVAKVQKGVEEKVATKINSIIDKTVVEKINAKTEALFDDFMNRPVSLSDGYGDRVKIYENLTALIKERFDNFMVQNVDSNGKTTDSSYSAKYKRIDYIIQNQLTTFAEKFTTDAVKKVSEEIKQQVSNGLTTKLGAELMRVLKVNEMLQIAK